MAGKQSRTQLTVARAIVVRPAFLGAAVGRVRMTGPDCGTTGH